MGVLEQRHAIPGPQINRGARASSTASMGIYFFVALVVASIPVIGLWVRFALSATGLCVCFTFLALVFVAFMLPLSSTNAKAVTLTKSAIQSIKGMSFFIVKCLPREFFSGRKMLEIPLYSKWRKTDPRTVIGHN
jgi:hypothetical protein